ncbi:hypothetical protein BTW01_12290 [Bacillus sp. SKDU12]|nr:hypothetical protein BTW01_12290 [Bacillus sp. SKDU12]
MREIKFQAWDLDAEQMYNWESIKQLFHEHLAHPRVKVRQYTGLKDKNAQEIYEGDVVKFAFNDEGENIRFMQIVFEGSGFKMKEIYRNYWLEKIDGVLCIKRGILTDRKGTLQELYKSNEIYTTEIIGNIYDNPELLEGAE